MKKDRNAVKSCLKLLLCALAVQFATTGLPSFATVSMPPIFGDHMVVQRGQKFTVWGTAASQEHITATIGEQRGSAIADGSGKWQIQFDPLPSFAALTLAVQGSNRLVFNDVLVGDVWLCSGQSNIAWPLGKSDAQSSELADVDKLKIRVFLVNTLGDAKPVPGPNDKFFAHWRLLSSKDLSLTPAIPYLFARRLQLQSGVPTAIVMLACGGAPIETFLPPETIQSCKVTPSAAIPGFKIGGNFQSALQPYLKYRSCGIVWYQGEANFNTPATYKKIFPTFIADWRRRLSCQNEPFYQMRRKTRSFKAEM